MSVLNCYEIEFKRNDGSEIASVTLNAASKQDANKIATKLKNAIAAVLDEHYAWEGWEKEKFSKTIITQQ